MEVILLCGIYLVELACFWLGLRILFEIKYKTRLVIILGGILPVIISLFPFEFATEKIAWLIVAILGILFVSIDGKIIEKGIWLILVFLLLECLDGIFTNTCEQVMRLIDRNSIYNKNYFLIKCCTLGSVILLNLVKEKIRRKKAHINLAIYFVIGIIVASMMICLAILNKVKRFLPNDKYIIICNILNVAVLVSVFLLLVFIVYIKNTHERMEQLLRTEQLLKEAQVNYYKQNLKKETDTRKYRHDMVNHLVYLQEILSINRLDDAKSYLKSILGGFKKIQNTYYVLGHEMIDTIMNYFFGMLPKDTEIVLKGRCAVNINMEDADICTIFSNLFQNAVEEITENRICNAKIIVEVYKGDQYINYIIKNSIHAQFDNNDINKNGLPKSHKSDAKSHGIGMINVKRAIEKYNGRFEWIQKEDYFSVNVVLPVKK
ncbi:MAG: GHKL domain-containing protein [Eubacterium sp.]|jgi:two-component system sensor histidine kinase AgrC|nr:GHKL domain-containing protein [Eubacterium sp.]